MKSNTPNFAPDAASERPKKKSRGVSPSARSTKYLRERGFIVCKVEQNLHMPSSPFPVKRDAFGFGDLLIARPGFGAALVQVTDASSITARIKKISGIAKDLSDARQVKEATFAHENAKKWLESGNRILVHGWRKGGARGQRKTWVVIEREVKLESE